MEEFALFYAYCRRPSLFLVFLLMAAVATLVVLLAGCQ